MFNDKDPFDRAVFGAIAVFGAVLILTAGWNAVMVPDPQRAEATQENDAQQMAEASAETEQAEEDASAPEETETAQAESSDASNTESETANAAPESTGTDGVKARCMPDRVSNIVVSRISVYTLSKFQACAIST